MPRLSQWQGVSIREDVLYSNGKGVEKPRLRKRNQHVLERLSTPLQQILEPGETVFYCFQAMAPLSQFQQLFLSWWAYSIMRTTLVITNRRILQFTVTRTGTWKRSVRAVYWGDLQNMRVSGWLSRQLTFTYAGGRKEKFWGIAAGEAGKLRALSAGLLPQSAAERTGADGMVSLCPECRAKLTPRIYLCPSCGLVFKNERQLVIMGLFVPGGVYFYTGHVGLGLVTGLLELFLWIEILGGVMITVANFGKPDFADVAAGTAYLFGILVLETLITISHGRVFVRMFIPTSERKATGHVSSSSATGATFQ